MSERQKALHVLIKLSLRDWLTEKCYREKVSLRVLVERWVEQMMLEEKELDE